MTDELMEIMDRIPPHALSVYLFMEHRSTLETKVGMTQQEISRATRLSVGAVRDALGWLEQPYYKDAGYAMDVDHKQVDSIAPLIRIRPAQGKPYHNVTLLPPYVGKEQRIRFTFEDTDSRRLGNLEKEVRRLATKKNRSQFSIYFRGEKHAMMREIESDIGRAVSIEEAFLLGSMTALVGPERVKIAWRTKAADMDKPILALYAMFNRQAFGKVRKDVQERDAVEYKPIVRDEEAL